MKQTTENADTLAFTVSQTHTHDTTHIYSRRASPGGGLLLH